MDLQHGIIGFASYGVVTAQWYTDIKTFTDTNTEARFCDFFQELFYLSFFCMPDVCYLLDANFSDTKIIINIDMR